MKDQKVFHKEHITELKEIINKVGSEKIFLVRGKQSYTFSGAGSFINNLIDDNKFVSFYDFDPNPQLDDLKKGISLFKQGNFELIIAIGGGSVLDMAKLISVFAHQNNNYKNIILEKDQINEKKTKLIAIPTTAGTGSEATHFAVLYVNKKKYSVAHLNILPDYVYLSSEFSKNTSPYLTACAGLDAFCQAIESIWSVHSTFESENKAYKAVKVIWSHLYKAVSEKDNIAFEEIQKAAFYAGEAINITKTTAPHALSYAFTSYYGIPHGHAVALSLPFFINYNYEITDFNCTDKRGAKAVKERIEKLLAILGLNPQNVQNALVNFFKSVGINININKLIKNFNPDIIIDNVNFERLNNNPRMVSKNDIANFLKISLRKDTI